MPSSEPTNAVRAAQVANAEAKRQHGIEPFESAHFRQAHSKSQILTAIVPFGLDDLRAEVFFKSNGHPDVRLNIITSRRTYRGLTDR